MTEKGKSARPYHRLATIDEAGRAVIDGRLIHCANAGHSQAQMLLARIHLTSDPHFRDVDKGVKWLRLAAEQGLPEAQIELGLLLLTGEEIEKNPEEAARLYCAAGLQGRAEGLFRLAMMFYFGSGIPRDLVSAYAWFSMAAAGGRTDARRQVKSLRALLTADLRAEAEALIEEIEHLKNRGQPEADRATEACEKEMRAPCQSMKAATPGSVGNPGI